MGIKDSLRREAQRLAQAVFLFFTRALYSASSGMATTKHMSFSSPDSSLKKL